MAMHHHGHSHPHPQASVTPSILRMSVWGRLAAVAVVIALLWSAVLWAMR